MNEWTNAQSSVNFGQLLIRYFPGLQPRKLLRHLGQTGKPGRKIAASPIDWCRWGVRIWRAGLRARPFRIVLFDCEFGSIREPCREKYHRRARSESCGRIWRHNTIRNEILTEFEIRGPHSFNLSLIHSNVFNVANGRFRTNSLSFFLPGILARMCCLIFVMQLNQYH